MSERTTSRSTLGGSVVLKTTLVRPPKTEANSATAGVSRSTPSGSSPRAAMVHQGTTDSYTTRPNAQVSAARNTSLK
jgi:hypothetical protein